FLAFDCEGLHAFGEDVTPRDVFAHVKPDGTVLVQEATWRRLDECPWTAALPRRTIAAGGRDALYEARLAPPPGETGTGPWAGGLLIVAGIDGGAGPERWATGRRTALVFEHTGGPLALEIAAGHGLPGDQGLSVLANGVRVQSARLPRLPATERLTVPIDGRAGWNEIEIVYDAVARAQAASPRGRASSWTSKPSAPSRTRTTEARTASSSTRPTQGPSPKKQSFQPQPKQGSVRVWTAPRRATGRKRGQCPPPKTATTGPPAAPA